MNIKKVEQDAVVTFLRKRESMEAPAKIVISLNRYDSDGPGDLSLEVTILVDGTALIGSFMESHHALKEEMGVSDLKTFARTEGYVDAAFDDLWTSVQRFSAITGAGFDGIQFGSVQRNVGS